MNVQGWRIWYTEGRNFHSRDTDWRDLPDDGVLILVLYYDEWSGDGNVRRRMVLSGDDWYFHRPDSDFFGSNSDSLEENRERYPDCIFKRGKWTTSEVFEEARQQAFDSTWSRQSGPNKKEILLNLDGNNLHPD